MMHAAMGHPQRHSNCAAGSFCVVVFAAVCKMRLSRCASANVGGKTVFPLLIGPPSISPVAAARYVVRSDKQLRGSMPTPAQLAPPLKGLEHIA